jgi:hypothetical protein
MRRRVSLARYAEKHGHHKYDRYFRVYDEALGARADQPLRLLEIGVSADSLTMWRSCFPAAEIVGLDFSPAGPTNQDELATVPGAIFVLGDQTDSELLESLGAFDVVVDDGGHRPEQQLGTFAVLFTRMNPGGWYFIEDLHTSYWPEYGEGSAVEFAKSLIDDLHARWAGATANWPVDELRVIDSLIAIRRI